MPRKPMSKEKAEKAAAALKRYADSQGVDAASLIPPDPPPTEKAELNPFVILPRAANYPIVLRRHLGRCPKAYGSLMQIYARHKRGMYNHAMDIQDVDNALFFMPLEVKDAVLAAFEEI